MKGYLVDAHARSISEIDYEYLGVSQWLPGGPCIGHVFTNGDVLMVDDEGLLRPATAAFRIKQRRDGQPMMSNGILTGRDDNLAETTLPPNMTMDELAGEIEWLSLSEAMAWFRARSSQPSMKQTYPDGTVVVLATWGDFVRNLEAGDGH